ncbi:cupredoxin domain-containing protein [Nocardia sp. NPDC004278]
MSSSQAPTAKANDTKTAAVTVDVADMKFSPADVTVKVGETVTWKFKDSVPHTVQGIGDKAMGINSPIFDRGQWSYTFTAPGTYRYLCSLHPQMRGTVTVE